MNWRLSLDPSVRAHLEKQISGTGKYKESYLKAKNPSNAQLWCAVTNLSMQLFNMNLKLSYLEKAFKELVNKLGSKKIVKRKKK